MTTPTLTAFAAPRGGAQRPSGGRAGVERRPVPAMTRAVVFAYHNVGVRCLRVLLAHGFEIPLVVTHADSPGETIWFGSVAAISSAKPLALNAFAPCTYGSMPWMSSAVLAPGPFATTIRLRTLCAAAMRSAPAG